MDENFNPKGYKIDDEGLIDVRELSKQQKDIMEACYLSIIDEVNKKLAYHFKADPLSPAMLNRMIGPLYTTFLHAVTEGFPEHVKQSTKLHAAEDLHGLIIHNLTVTDTKEKLR